MSEPQKDFFISYNKADRGWAEWIAWQLEAAGYSTVNEAWDFRPGSNFALDMQKALAEAERLIAVFSPDYLAAVYTQPEWAAVFANDPTGEKGLIVPVMVRDCEPKGLLKSIVYVDLRGLAEEAACKTLLAGIDRGRAKPSTAPPFPRGMAFRGAAKPPFPGALPPIWRMPHTRNPNFTGREKILKSLYDDLHSGKAAALTQAIAGLGGVGKTQIAVEYAYRHAGEYSAVWWIESEDPSRLASDYAALAAEYGLPEKDAKEQPVIVDAVRRHLEHVDRWLLIFDNAETADAIRPYLPGGTGGHVIITSRSTHWSQIGHILDVPTFDPRESVKYLLDRTGQKDKKSAQALAEELGHLPLALAQAAAFMSETGMSLAEYLECFKNRRGELWSAEKGPLDHKETVKATFSLAIERVGAECPAAIDLLNLCAFLAPDDIPLSLLSASKGHLPETLATLGETPLERAKCVAALKQYSLADVAHDALSMHRLVQAVLRGRLGEEDIRKRTCIAVDIVNDAFPDGVDTHVDSWPICASLVTHARTALSHAESLEAAPSGMPRLLNQMALYLRVRAEFTEARALMERSLAVDEKALGKDHPNVAVRLSNLAAILIDIGDLTGAKPLAERALAIDEEALGRDHPGVAKSLTVLANILRGLGDTRGAIPLVERALNIGEKTFGNNHANLAILFNNLAATRHSLGNLEGAKEAANRALAIYETTSGKEDRNVTLVLGNLAMILRDLGDLKGAKRHAERALAIDEKALGKEHPGVATDLSNLALILQDLGELKGAKPLAERALAIVEKALGREHPSVAICLNNLAAILRDLGDLDGADKRHERALKIARKALGENHPNTKRYAANLEVVREKLRARGGK